MPSIGVHGWSELGRGGQTEDRLAAIRGVYDSLEHEGEPLSLDTPASLIVGIGALPAGVSINDPMRRLSQDQGQAAGPASP